MSQKVWLTLVKMGVRDVLLVGALVKSIFKMVIVELGRGFLFYQIINLVLQINVEQLSRSSLYL